MTKGAAGAMDAAFLREVLDTNVLGMVLLTQAVVPHLPSPGGRIVLFASRLAVSPIPTSSVYAAAKAAVSTLAQAFSKELEPKGITINAVAPGAIETDMTADIIRERAMQSAPARRSAASERPATSLVSSPSWQRRNQAGLRAAHSSRMAG